MNQELRTVNRELITMNYKNLSIFILILAYLIPLVITLYSIFTGSIAFWYDPARDLLAGLANIEKLTLIGPTSGIPGLFYGPYWIWMLSLALLISQDPKIASLIVAALPYFLILPFIFFALSRVVGKKVAVIGWLLFMLSYGKYSFQLWNPHPAPLLVFVLITLIVFLPENFKSYKDYLYMIITGFVAGLLIQFHISFGIAVVSGVYLCFLLSFLFTLHKVKHKKDVVIKNIKTLILITSGILFSALPFFVFEIRHGFGQITTIINTLTSPDSVVGVTGISNNEIILYFFLRFAALINLPLSISIGLGLIILLFFAYQLKQKKIHLSVKELRLLLTTVIIGLTVLFVYLTSKNPVWDYHFIGVEVLFVLLCMLVISKSKILTYIGGILAVLVTVVAVNNFVTTLSSDPIELTSLATKEHIVNRVFDDAKDSNFALIAYNPAIYTFDYDYLSQWIAEKNNREIPATDSKSAEVVYIIIPPNTSQAITEDFLNYKTPNEVFRTVEVWEIADGSTVYKRTTAEWYAKI